MAGRSNVFVANRMSVETRNIFYSLVTGSGPPGLVEGPLFFTDGCCKLEYYLSAKPRTEESIIFGRFLKDPLCLK